MKKEKMKKTVASLNGLIEFEYDGKYGNIESYYIPSTHSSKYLLFYDNKEITLETAEQVLNTSFFNGKTLLDIAEKIEDFDY